MSYGRYPYGGVGYAGADAAFIPADTETHLAVEVSFAAGALDPPVWVDITPDVRSWDTSRGRKRELERFQPGRATVVLSNLERQYDSVNAAGPWFGNLRPMRRMRIRETFNGATYDIFDGYVDKWQLDYPGTGHDATATIMGTDAYKIFARTDLPNSVYEHEVREDSPVSWWRLGNPAVLTTGLDQIGDRDLTYADSPVSGDALVFGSKNGSTLFTHPPAGSGNVAEASVSMPVTYPFTVEATFRSQEQSETSYRVLFCIGGNESAGAAQRVFEVAIMGQPGGSSASGAVIVRATDNGFTDNSFFYTTGLRWDDKSIHHVVVHAVSSDPDDCSIWVDGVERSLTVFDNGVIALPTGTVDLAVGNVTENYPDAGEYGLDGELQDVVLYQGTLSAERIATHYAAATHPWQNDLPGPRIDRILDFVGWPSARRELDDGATTLQSATLNMPALEHLQKVAETEFGLFFVTRNGSARLMARSTMFARTPGPQVFGDANDGTEVGYTAVVPDDGDDVIRNHARISRLNGAVQTATDAASETEFGRYDHTVEGLYHRSEAHSQSYANFVVAEYAHARRRISSLTLGPPGPGEAATVYPAMLAVEIGQAIVVRSRPTGGGAMFEQTCAVEGINHSGSPGGLRKATLRLSPEFTEVF